MELGLGGLHSIESGETAAAVARAAEAAGFHSLWLGEHIALPAALKSSYPILGNVPFDHRQEFLEAMVTLGFMAGATERIRLGTAVIPMLARDPVSLAKQAATLDLLSGGRLELGLGAGWCREEAELLGHPHDHPNGRLAEAIEILRAAWSEETFSYEGRHWQLPAMGVHPRPPQGADITVWVGGLGDRALRVASEQGDGTLVPRSAVQRTSEVRKRLPAEKKVAVLLSYTGTGADEEQARAIRDAGADLLVVMIDQGGAPVARDAGLRAVDRLARTLMPIL